MNTPVRVLYRNHRGEIAWRNIIPDAIFFKATDWHPEPQWILRVWDCDKKAVRDYAMSGFLQWDPPKLKAQSTAPEDPPCSPSMPTS